MKYCRLIGDAARAHGGLVFVNDIGWIHEDGVGNRGAWWNPLEDDGDALRLAAKLEIDVYFRVIGGLSVEALAPGCIPHREAFSEGGSAKAARIAIVNAAAKIGAGAK